MTGAAALEPEALRVPPALGKETRARHGHGLGEQQVSNVCRSWAWTPARLSSERQGVLKPQGAFGIRGAPSSTRAPVSRGGDGARLYHDEVAKLGVGVGAGPGALGIPGQGPGPQVLAALNHRVASAARTPQSPLHEARPQRLRDAVAQRPSSRGLRALLVPAEGFRASPPPPRPRRSRDAADAGSVAQRRRGRRRRGRGEAAEVGAGEGKRVGK